MSIFASLRYEYHKSIKEEIIRNIQQEDGVSYYNMADVSNQSSIEISKSLVNQLPGNCSDSKVTGQTAGNKFEKFICRFIQSSFGYLQNIRPGSWEYSTNTTEISRFDQYAHLHELELLVNENKTLKSIVGSEYIIKPDIILARKPVEDAEINSQVELVDDKIAQYSPLRKRKGNHNAPILHASISCKWTIRSDRSQNTRTEALNLIRNRKGNLPHIICVTAEPLPTRIATIALGTGDMDCVYHFALGELVRAVEIVNNRDQLEMLMTMIEGRRLRDIADLPLDLAI